MPEREPQTSERVNIHERGGLTPEHWQEIMKRIGWRKGEIGAKIVNYGQMVVSGEFPQGNYHHCMYLGRRHWVLISKKTEIKNTTVTKLLPRTNRNNIRIQLANEAYDFATSEIRRTYTLNDYIQRLGARISTVWGMIEWSNADKVWEAYINLSRNQAIRQLLLGRYREGPVSPKLLLGEWLLSENECSDPQHTEPGILLEKLLLVAAQNPREIQNRLKNRLNSLTVSPLFRSQTIGLLEKEIR